MIEKQLIVDWIQELKVDVKSENWSASQISEISDQLVTLSKTLIPCIVEDVPVIDNAIIQSFLLNKIETELNNWLAKLAASYRAFNRTEANSYSTSNKSYKIGLRGASLKEIESLPVLGPKLTQDVAEYVTNNPFVTDINELEKIKGLGAAGVNIIAENAYLDNPVLGFISPKLASFINSPVISSFLPVLDTSDLSFFLGGRYSMKDQGGEKDHKPSVFDRFMSFLETVQEQSERKYSKLNGSRMSSIASWQNRQTISSKVLSKLEPATIKILENEAYFHFIQDQIEKASEKIYLMVFLGTVSETENTVSPLNLIEKLEEAKDRGVDVKVILDRDDEGEHYKSRFINSKLYNRLVSKGVPVRFDEKETLLHSKVIIFDDKKAVVGSHNWTLNSFNNTNELSIYFSQKLTAEAYKDQFMELWNQLN